MLQTSVEDLQGAEETERRAKEKAIKTAAAEAAAEKRKATQARVERMKDWDDEEVRMLEKALEKFPQVGIPLFLFLFLRHFMLMHTSEQTWTVCACFLCVFPVLEECWARKDWEPAIIKSTS